MTGCTNLEIPPKSVLSVEPQIPPMSRADVIVGIQECESAGLRPIILSAGRRVNNQLTPAVIEVTCLPRLSPANR